ncbi:MAG TPA: hypothetical protein VEC75_02665 [Stellaceae bacterium]|nr:hypothetical protein [Stellaceae bacterium]HYC13120.1 hypothetical protein [Stellaceae bacterium]
MSDPAQLLTLQFLSWLATRPRSYGEVKDAWRSTCPRLTIWEDAVESGLIQFQNGGERLSDRSAVTLTPRGRALLEREVPAQ